jgi:hypothetical protein
MQVRKPVVTKAASFTLDMYQVKSGSRITTRGATGAVTATLPTPQTGSMSWDGYSVEFHGVADQTITVSGRGRQGGRVQQRWRRVAGDVDRRGRRSARSSWRSGTPPPASGT